MEKKLSDDQVNHTQSKLNHLYDSASVVASHADQLKNLFGKDARKWTIGNCSGAIGLIYNIEYILREIRKEVKEL